MYTFVKFEKSVIFKIARLFADRFKIWIEGIVLIFLKYNRQADLWGELWS